MKNERQSVHWFGWMVGWLTKWLDGQFGWLVGWLAGLVSFVAPAELQKLMQIFTLSQKELMKTAKN